MIKIAHRGLMGLAPENTLLSFEKALHYEFEIVELDVYLCKSGELVVIHDEKLNRTCKATGYVWDFTLMQLQAVDAGQGQNVSSLVQVLDLIDARQKVNIELKGEGTSFAVSEIIKHYVINKNWSYDNFIVSSFNHIELYKFKKISPEIYLGMLISCMPIDLSDMASRLGVQSINLSLEFINREIVDHAHSNGLDVYVWTVNYLDDFMRMKDLGVDGVFTNYDCFIP